VHSHLGAGGCGAQWLCHQECGHRVVRQTWLAAQVHGVVLGDKLAPGKCLFSTGLKSEAGGGVDREAKMLLRWVWSQCGHHIIACHAANERCAPCRYCGYGGASGLGEDVPDDGLC
jgi:hypothetical protein